MGGKQSAAATASAATKSRIAARAQAADVGNKLKASVDDPAAAVGGGRGRGGGGVMAPAHRTPAVARAGTGNLVADSNSNDSGESSKGAAVASNTTGKVDPAVLRKLERIVMVKQTADPMKHVVKPFDTSSATVIRMREEKQYAALDAEQMATVNVPNRLREDQIVRMLTKLRYDVHTGKHYRNFLSGAVHHSSRFTLLTLSMNRDDKSYSSQAAAAEYGLSVEAVDKIQLFVRMAKVSSDPRTGQTVAH